MATEIPRQSAQIIQFPVNARRSGDTPRAEMKRVNDVAALRVCADTSASGWYHEEAIREAKLARDR